MANLREQHIAEIIAELEDENARFEQEAMSWAEADYEAIPEDIRTPHCDKAATAFIQSRYEEYLKWRIVVDYDSIVIAATDFIIQGKKIRVSFPYDKNENTMSLIQNMLFESCMSTTALTKRRSV